MATISKRRDRWAIGFYDAQGKRRWITMPNRQHNSRSAQLVLLKFPDENADCGESYYGTDNF